MLSISFYILIGYLCIFLGEMCKFCARFLIGCLFGVELQWLVVLGPLCEGQPGWKDGHWVSCTLVTVGMDVMVGWRPYGRG